MDYSNDIHEEFENMGQIQCPICDEQLQEHTVKNEKCCKTMKIENGSGEIYV